jgi:hypothetical protein
VACEECAPAYRKREVKDRSYLSRFAEMTCATCNRTVVVKKSGRGARRWAAAFCCERCQWTFYNTERNERAARTREKTCEACGEAFTATRRDAKTCSPACKQKAYRLRRKGLDAS